MNLKSFLILPLVFLTVLTRLAQDETGLIYMDKKNYNQVMNGFSLLIVFYYKGKSVRSEVIHEEFVKISSKLGLEKGLYPFAQILAGTEDLLKVKSMADIVIFKNRKAKFHFKGEPDEWSIFSWLRKCLAKVFKNLNILVGYANSTQI